MHCCEGGADSVDDAENVGGRAEAATRVTRRSSRAPTKPMEQMPWDAACFIRGEKDAAKGKDHRLPSLSLKHLSDVFDAAIDRLAEYGTGRSHRRATTPCRPPEPRQQQRGPRLAA